MNRQVMEPCTAGETAADKRKLSKAGEKWLFGMFSRLAGINKCLLWLAVAACLGGCQHSSGGAAGGGPIVVRVQKPQVKEVTDYVYFTGRTDAIESVAVRARDTGYLLSIDFTPGAEVQPGQQLFKIDPRPYKATYDQTQGQVQLAEAQLKLAKADLARAREVAKTPGAISTADLDKFAAAAAEAEAQLEANRANAENAELNLEFTNVISPIRGIVGRNLLTVGNLVQQDSTLLTTVVSQDPMYVYFDVDERTFLRAQQLIREGKIKPISQGGKIRVDIGLANEENEYPHEGVLDFVNNQVTAATGTIQLRGVWPNPKLTPEGSRLLRPGMFVRVRLPMGPPTESLVVSQAALGSNQGEPYLLVVGKDNRVEYRPVKPGPELPGGLQVMEPVPIVLGPGGSARLPAAGEASQPSLAAEDLIIVAGLQQAKPGDIVTPKPIEPELKSVAGSP